MHDRVRFHATVLPAAGQPSVFRPPQDPLRREGPVERRADDAARFADAVPGDVEPGHRGLEVAVGFVLGVVELDLGDVDRRRGVRHPGDDAREQQDALAQVVHDPSRVGEGDVPRRHPRPGRQRRLHGVEAEIAAEEGFALGAAPGQQVPPALDDETVAAAPEIGEVHDLRRPISAVSWSGSVIETVLRMAKLVFAVLRPLSASPFTRRDPSRASMRTRPPGLVQNVRVRSPWLGVTKRNFGSYSTWVMSAKTGAATSTRQPMSMAPQRGTIPRPRAVSRNQEAPQRPGAATTVRARISPPEVRTTKRPSSPRARPSTRVRRQKLRAGGADRIGDPVHDEMGEVRPHVPLQRRDQGDVPLPAAGAAADPGDPVEPAADARLVGPVERLVGAVAQKNLVDGIDAALRLLLGHAELGEIETDLRREVELAVGQGAGPAAALLLLDHEDRESPGQAVRREEARGAGPDHHGVPEPRGHRHGSGCPRRCASCRQRSCISACFSGVTGKNFPSAFARSLPSASSTSPRQTR